MPRHSDNLYRTHGEETILLSKHPLPNLLIMDANQNRSKSHSNTSPGNKEGRKLDNIGCWHYSLASFSLRTSEYLCAMEVYTRHVMQNFLPFFEGLPEDQKTKAMAYHADVMALTDYETIAACHVVDAAAKQIATAVYLCRRAWLRTTTIIDDARNCIEDSPFDS
ncbi:hypothetical protein JRQ81_003007 [Phrynocephalus forsythii]|uniref:Uncharacterized protein n=1 Tax=Phrynocephalus forsythii TaxID=171643 RepID=A0A9Q1AX12_9SAUR|nr:hypothetical protein JRQ81_003007 [Phrynocephalus forsythii]